MDSLACKICTTRFKTIYLLKHHMRRHTEEKRYISDKRGMGFTKACILKGHTRIHTGEKPYICSPCNKTFVHYGALKTHNKIHSEENAFICLTCGKSFYQKSNLHAHERIHTEEKPYICKVCGKAFIQKVNLNAHERIHSGVKPYICKTCGKSFTQKGNLDAHERIHSEEKPYICKTCGKSFTQKGNLNTHERLHSGVKPYIYKTCGKAFTGSGNLKRHNEIRKGKKHHICRKAFKHISNLKVPENFHSGQKLYKCKTLGKIFAYRHALKRHERLHREVKSDTSSLGVREFSLKSNVKIPDKIDSEDICSQFAMSFSQSTQLKIHMESHQIKDWDQYYSISFANIEYSGKFLNLEKKYSLEMFTNLFETDSLKSIMHTNTPPTSSLLSHGEIQEQLIQSSLEVSTGNLHTVYSKSQPEESRLMSIEELNNPQQFFL